MVNGDTPASLNAQPTLTTHATAGSHVSGSPYAITVSGAADPDYTISYVPGTLTVTPAPLTIKADNQIMVYGAGLPALTASYSGLGQRRYAGQPQCPAHAHDDGDGDQPCFRRVRTPLRPAGPPTRTTRSATCRGR